ncbi:hypothetical protein B0T25DRAFT_551813 [Lasiosphaeria hispida]|uniref:Secreted protein n=1 Tax=Lasiosphaeria hispida TaxID=260671 RepID=A0AAJ0HB47_9PEZI|nr:hypothetical protein B0T25DRAFT_551813 [Lasiosphaeria hispida]
MFSSRLFGLVGNLACHRVLAMTATVYLGQVIHDLSNLRCGYEILRCHPKSSCSTSGLQRAHLKSEVYLAWKLCLPSSLALHTAATPSRPPVVRRLSQYRPCQPCATSLPTQPPWYFKEISSTLPPHVYW